MNLKTGAGIGRLQVKIHAYIFFGELLPIPTTNHWFLVEKGKRKPGSKQGGWHNEKTKESLRADFDHAPPIKPHWDYKGPRGRGRANLDGTWDWKND